MCGILGKINFESKNHIYLNHIKQMTDSLSHRGPDNEGIWIHKNYSLGFKRLSIIDLSESGNQPFHNENNSIHMVLNGEIYNYKELREKLILLGHKFTSNSDAEVVLHGYEEWGTNILTKINGMFGLAIVDLNSNTLLLARDKLGIKPLIYSINKNTIRFGSEIKAITADPTCSLSIDKLALNLYFIKEVIPAPYTIYNEIKKLQPGHFLTISIEKGSSSKRIQPYWDLNFKEKLNLPKKEWIKRVQDLAQDAVKTHTISDVPIGAFLSGGIDSSAVVANICKQQHNKLKTFTARFLTKEEDEGKYAQIMANKYKTEHHTLTIDIPDNTILKNIVNTYDEPFGDSSAIPTYLISEKASKYVKVILSGDGGDELFGGYLSNKEIMKINITKFLNPLFFKSLTKLNKSPSIKRLSLPKWLLYASLHSHIFDDTHLNVLQKDYRSNWETILSTFDYLKPKLKDLNPFDSIFYTFFKTYLPDDILTKVDRASSAHSLETRVPLLDYRFAELSSKIPYNFKLKGQNQKYIFIESIKHLLPNEILNHKKHGFSIPTKKWVKSKWLNDLIQIKINTPEIHEFINFDTMNSWSPCLTWQVLCFSYWFTQNKSRLHS
ncbi:asparagine synthase (glutamine-hydrolyzing) [Candidatus Marinamargulisbacteria bacterium SCGC AG-414-C22]|nr:asparagine synthase (glutamine-hydrolyzing) [Candidatus Marinamargulisbacteria bacterium SCGC AG-414-C22]